MVPQNSLRRPIFPNWEYHGHLDLAHLDNLKLSHFAERYPSAGYVHDFVRGAAER